MERPKRPRLVRLLLSLLLMSAVALPATYILRPHVTRWYYAQQLISSDLERREKALNYLILRGRRDPKLVQYAIAKLDVKDRENFLQITSALDRAGQWRRPTVTPRPWLRWLTILAEGDKPESRIFTARFVAEMKEVASDNETVALVTRLQNDADDNVRYNALVAAAELSANGNALAAYRAHLVRGTFDSAPDIARQAWIFVGLFDAAGGLEGNWRVANPSVAEAMLWALSRRTMKPEEILTALGDPNLSPAVSPAFAYALVAHHGVASQAAQLSALEKLLVLPKEQAALPVWRLVLGFEPQDPKAPSPTAGLLIQDKFAFLTEKSPTPMALAAVRQMGPWLLRHPQNPFWTTPLAAEPLAKLAMLEGLTPGDKFDERITPETPDLLRVVATDVAASPSIATLRPVFNAGESSLRDIAVVVAADRFTSEQQRELIESLLVDYDDNAKIAGAMLVGLTGEHRDLLRKKMADEDVWPVMQFMKLGLWMGDQSTDMDKVLDGMFARKDIATTTLLLALLHKRPQLAFDNLFNPRGESIFDLVKLFDEQRWWRVVRRALPADAPPFWVWADPGLERLQLDILRNWYLLNRVKIGATPTQTSR